MTERDYDDFFEIVAGFAELKGRELSSAAVKLYWRTMRHWPIDEFRAAAEHLLRTCEFMPVPKDFEALRNAGRPTSAEAWERARRFAGSLYHPTGYRDGECGDACIDLAVRAIGGYPAIAMCDTDKLHFLERQFAERYTELLDVTETRERLPALVDLNTRTTIRTGGPKPIGEIAPDVIDADGRRPKRA